MDKYIPKNILLTGGAGFIGSNLINFFLENYDNIKIYNIDKLDYCSRTKNVIYKHNYKFIKGNINQNDLITYILNEYKIDTVIHLAAQSHVDNSFGNSIEFTKDNIMGTHCLLECCRIYQKVKRFIHISTDEVYGEVNNESQCNEKSILNPTNPYAATKAGAEFMVKSYYKSFKLPIIITRGNNVFGPRQYPEKLIPKFILSLSNDKKCSIHGEGKSRRNFIYVDDVSRAINTILLYGKINEIYNIGTDNEYSVMDIADILVNKLKSNSLEENINYIEDRHFNDYRYSISSQKLRDLGWKEEVKFIDGIDRTIKWYLDNKDYW